MGIVNIVLLWVVLVFLNNDTTEEKEKKQVGAWLKGEGGLNSKKRSNAKNLDDTVLSSSYDDPLEDFAVLAAADFAENIIIVLVAPRDLHVVVVPIGLGSGRVNLCIQSRYVAHTPPFCGCARCARSDCGDARVCCRNNCGCRRGG